MISHSVTPYDHTSPSLVNVASRIASGAIQRHGRFRVWPSYLTAPNHDVAQAGNASPNGLRRHHAPSQNRISCTSPCWSRARCACRVWSMPYNEGSHFKRGQIAVDNALARQLLHAAGDLERVAQLGLQADGLQLGARRARLQMITAMVDTACHLHLAQEIAEIALGGKLDDQFGREGKRALSNEPAQY